MAADDLIPRVSRRSASILEAIARRLEREVMQLVADLDTTAGVLSSTRHNAATVAAIRDQVAAVAEREGVTSVVAQLRGDLPAVIREALRDHPDLGAFAPQITADLERVLLGGEAEVARAISEGAADAVAEAVRHAVTGALDVRALAARVAEALDTSLGRAVVTVDRAVRDFHDRVLLDQARASSDLLDDDEWVWVYTGPDDSRTRPYCAARVGRVLTEQHVVELDPQERYNCRHRPTPRLASEVVDVERYAA